MTERRISPIISGAIVALLLLTGPLSSFAQSEPASSFRCNFGAGERLIDIDYPAQADGGGCAVVYEKRTEGAPPRVIWKAKYDMSFCAKKLLATVDKLSAGGWQCSPSGSGSALKSMTLPDVDRVLPLKAGVDAKQPASNQNRAPLARKIPVTAAATLPRSAKQQNSLPLKDTRATLSKSKDKFDDWIFRWDDNSKQLVFTLYDSKQPSKVRSFSWAHDDLSQSTPSPSNIVLALDENDNQILIVAWPTEKTQHITVLEPLFQERPVCEIETESKRDSGWSYMVENKKLFLTGVKARAGKPGELVEFRRACSYTR